MAEIQPLRTLRYEPRAVGSLAAVIAPPYDVIDAPMRSELVARSPFNVVEIDLPQPNGSDPYLHAADVLHRYETARVYADEVGGEGEHRYVLMFLCSTSDPGLTVFPTHRLLTGLREAPDKQQAIRAVLTAGFEVEAVDWAALEAL